MSVICIGFFYYVQFADQNKGTVKYKSLHISGIWVKTLYLMHKKLK